MKPPIFWVNFIYENPNKKYFGVRKENTQVVPHRDTYDSINEMLEDPNVSEKDKDFMKNIQTMLPNEAESYTQYESDKQILERAKNSDCLFSIDFFTHF